MIAITSNANPLAERQGTVCSAFKRGATVCRHGHVQSSACSPHIFEGRWSPKEAPWCVNQDDMPPHVRAALAKKEPAHE